MFSKNPTLQEVFDHIQSCIRKQGGPSIFKGHPLPTYLGDGETRCPVGWCFPEPPSQYHSLYNSPLRLDSLILTGRVPEVIQWMTEETMSYMLSRLQRLHDNFCTYHSFGRTDFSCYWEQGTERIAKDYRLIYTPPN